MSMILIITLVVIFAAIFIFFSAEFSGVFKKIFAVPGLLLVTQLTLFSLFVQFYESWILWGLVNIQLALRQFIVMLTTQLPPFSFGNVLTTKIAVLFLIAFLPIWKIQSLTAKSGGFKTWPNARALIAAIWIFIAIVYTLP